MGTNDAEANKELVVDGSCNIQQGGDNTLDTPDTLGVKQRAVFVFGSILHVCAVNNGAMFVRG